MTNEHTDCLEKLFAILSNTFVGYIVATAAAEARDDFDREVLAFYEEWNAAEQSRLTAIAEILRRHGVFPGGLPWPLEFSQFNYVGAGYLLRHVVTRMGWTTDPRERSYYHWAAVPEDQKADYLPRAYRWANENWSNWVGVIFVPLGSAQWTMEDDAYWWATANSDGCARPSYYALREMPK